MSYISYTFQPKFLDPKGLGRVLLVPADKDLRGPGDNYIIVVSSPTYNGVYKVSREVLDKCDRGLNGKGSHQLVCLYVDVADCEFVMKLEDVQNPVIQAKIKEVQGKYKTFREKEKKKKAKLASQDTLN